MRSSILVGVDLVRIGDVTESIRRFGDRYLHRVFTPDELRYCRGQQGGGVEQLSARFAAKEATLKVLRPQTDWLDFRAIEVARDRRGACDIVLHGPSRRLARRAGIFALSVSLTHEGEYAAAVVMAQVRKPRRRQPVRGARAKG